MKTAVRINFARYIIFFFAAFVVLFFVNKIFAQSPSPSSSPAPSGSPASTSEFAFPVKDLGGCNSLEACTNYCEDPVNYNSCSNFAKRNGFYKDDKTTYATDTFWDDAKKELGCDSRENCTTFCSDSKNFHAVRMQKEMTFPVGIHENLIKKST